MALFKKTQQSEQPGVGVGIDATHPLASSLVFQWTAKQGPVETKAGTPATYTAAKLATDAYLGKALQSISFDGSSTKLDFGDLASFDFGTGLFSFEMLVWLDASGPSSRSFFLKDDKSGQRSIFLETQGSGGLRWGFANNVGGFTAIDTTGLFPTGRWVHILACRTGSTSLSMYLDGVAPSTSVVISSATSVGATSASVVLGASSASSLYLSSGSRIALARAYSGNISAWAGSLARNPWQLFESQAIDTEASAAVTAITATVGDAVANGVAASVSTNVTISGAVGNAVADGSSANVSTSVLGTVGNAVADGTAASVYQGSVISTTVGNAVADGVLASVTTSGDTTINATVGNAVADGALATLHLGIVVSGLVGNAVADGETASVGDGTSSFVRYFDVLSGKLLVLRQL